MQSIDYYQPGSVVTTAMSNGVTLVVTRVNDDVANAHLLDADGAPVALADYVCHNRTTDKIIAPYKEGWLLSWASTYFIFLDGTKLATIECKRSQEIRAI
jgi:hypothetical protein